jgi:hypothetical protein
MAPSRYWPAEERAIGSLSGTINTLLVLVGLGPKRFTSSSGITTRVHAPSVNINVGQHHSCHHRYNMRDEGYSVSFSLYNTTQHVSRSNLLFCGYDIIGVDKR